MATRTDNLKLSKAETSDAIKSTLTANNQNFDKLDGIITRLKNNQLQGTASGTEIILTDAGEIESILHISGNSEQDSRSGKNKFDSKVAVLQSDGTSTTVTNNSVKVGITTVSSFYTSSILPIKDSQKLLGKTLTLSAKMTASATNTAQIRLMATDSKGLVNSEVGRLKKEENYVTLTMPSQFPDGTIQFALRFYSNVGSSTAQVGDYVTYTDIQLEEGTVATEYEQYGVKPSPEFESPIMSVKSKSDNLFDISKKKDNTSFVWSSGADYANTGAIRSDYIPIDDIKEICSNYRFIATFHDKDKKYLGNGAELTTAATNAVYNMVMPNNTNIAYFSVTYKSSANVAGNPADMTTVKDIMLNKGTVALPYQPYGYIPAEARAEGKNLFDQDLVVTEGITKRLETGFRMEKYENNRMGTKYYIPLKAGQYKLVGNVNTNVENQGDVSFQINKADGSVSYLQADSMLAGGLTFTSSKDIVRIQPYFQATVASGKYWEVTDFMILRKEETDTTYAKGGIDIVELPLGDIELRSTPDGTRDTFTRIDGVWNKKNNVGNTIANGQNGQVASIVSSYCTENHNAFTISGIKPIWIKASCNGYSNKFKVITNGNDINGKDEPNLYFGNVSKAEIWVKVSKEVAPTVADFRTWLPNNPIEIQYPLAEPTYTPITDQALISALDELEELILHKGYNRITVTAVNGVKAYLDLTYNKDINIVLNNMSAMIASIGGEMNV